MDLVSLEFWQYADRLVAESECVIDRPKESAYPRSFLNDGQDYRAMVIRREAG